MSEVERMKGLLVLLCLTQPLLAKTLTAVEATPRGVALKIGSSYQLKAACSYDDGSHDDCGGQGGVRWSSTTPKNLSVTAGGLLRWTGAVEKNDVGIGYVLATVGGKQDRTAVYAQHAGDTWYQYPTPDVRNYAVEGSGAPLPLNVAVGATVTMGSGLVINNDGSQGQSNGRPLQATCNWTSSNEAAATVDRYGQVKALAPGQVTVTCGEMGDAVFGRSGVKGWGAAGREVGLTIVPGGRGKTTWYVRQDGGTVFVDKKRTPHGQCDGRSDKAYPGKGVNQPCAVGNMRYLWADGEQGSPREWMIAGGDTVLVAKKEAGYPTGLDAPNPYQNVGAGKTWSPVNCQGDPYCTMPTIPSGTEAQPTRILGANYASCGPEDAKTKLLVSYGARAAFNVKDSQFVEIRCFEITDEAECATNGNFQHSCGKTGASWGSSGIAESALTSKVLYQDLFLHGLADAAIAGAVGVGVVADSLHIRGMPMAGIDMDDSPWQSGNISVAGGFEMRNSITEFTGCVEEFPIKHKFPLIECRDQNTGGYGDGFGTGSTTGDWKFDHDIWRYNYQDGLDLLHSGMQSLIVTNSRSYGNDGQSYKIGSADSVIFRNNTSLANCNRILTPIGDEPPEALTPGVVGCRANGDQLLIQFTDVGTYLIQANSLAGYGSVMWDMMCETGWDDCSHAHAVYQSNAALGLSAPGYNDGQRAAIFYQGSENMPRSMGWSVRDHNLYFNGKHGDLCGKRDTGDLCVDPLFANQPALKVTDEASLDAFEFVPSARSPLLHAGLATGGVEKDAMGVERPERPAIGAVEYRAVTGGERQGPTSSMDLAERFAEWRSNLRDSLHDAKVRWIEPLVTRVCLAVGIGC